MKLSKNKLTFEYTNDNDKMFTTQKLLLTNRGNATAEFIFKLLSGPASLFTVEPAEGTIKKGCELEIIFTYTSKGKKKDKPDIENAELWVENGDPKKIILEGITPAVRVSALD